MKRYQINGISVAKYSPGSSTDKPPVIMVHGGNHGAWCWDKWASLFAEAGFEVHVPDWYNHGESDKLPEEEFIKRGIIDVAHKEIKFVADELGRTPIVIGHSMGGLAAAAYATFAPVEKLALICPVMPSVVHAPAVPVPVDMTKPFPVFPPDQMRGMFFTATSEEDFKQYYDLLVPESSQAVHETVTWSDDVDISAIKAPILLMAAELDQAVPLEPLKQYAEMLHAEFKLVKGIGHSDMLLKEPEWRAAAEQALDWAM